jgi:hypothetical protein
MPKDYVGGRIGKILMPGDPGFNDPKLPWGRLRNMVGWKKPEAVKIQISGFFLIDRRASPAIAIFKNMSIIGNKNHIGEEPIPFISLDEALHYKESMHLSSDDELKVKPVALAPDPGLGNSMPNRMWMDRKTAKKM